MQQLLGHQRGLAPRCPTANRGRLPLRASAAASGSGSGSSDVKSARLSRILRQYESAGVEGQKEELDAYVSQRFQSLRVASDAPGYSRGMRASGGSRATTQRIDERDELYMPLRSDGTRQPNVGLHGKGKECWWALRVQNNREKQVCEALERSVETLLPPLEPAEEGGAPRQRTIETWAPKKVLKVWNPKTEKMGSKSLRYPATYPELLQSGENGGWVLFRAELDAELYNRIKPNPSVLGWHFVEQYQGKDFPIPVKPELIDAIKDWEADVHAVEEATVRAKLGIPVKAAVTWEEPEVEPAADQWQRGSRGSYGDREGGGRGGGRFGDREGGGRGRGRFGDREAGGGRFGGGRFGDRDGGRGGRGGERYGERRFEERRFEGGDREGPASMGTVGGWFEGGGVRRERQGTGLYAGADASGADGGGGAGGWQEGGDRPPLRFAAADGSAEGGGGYGDRQFEPWERRSGGDWEDRRGGAGGRFGDRDGGRGRGRFGDREGGRGRGRFGDRDAGGGGRGGFGERRFDRDREGGGFADRRGGDREGGRPRGGGSEGGWFDGSSSSGSGSGSGWFDGGAATEAGGGASAWDSGNAGQQGGEDSSGAFSGWFDSAAAAFDFDSPAAAPAPAAPAAPAAAPTPAAASSDGGWAWDEVPAAAATPAAAAATPAAPAAPAVDAAGIWDDSSADAGLGWGGGAAFGLPAVGQQQPQQQGDSMRVQRSSSEGRGGGRERDGGSRFGERRDRDGGNRFGERRERDGGSPRRDGGEGRYGDRRGDREGGGAWYDGDSRGSSGAEASRDPAPDLSWWDNDGASAAAAAPVGGSAPAGGGQPAAAAGGDSWSAMGDALDDGGFAGVYSGSPDWERRGNGGSTDERRSGDRQRRDDRGSDFGGRREFGGGGRGRGERDGGSRDFGRGGRGERDGGDRRGGSWERDGGDRRSGGWEGASDSAGGSGGGGGDSPADVAAAAAFQPGQQVAVTGGNFRDFEGKVVQASGGRLIAELDIFGKQTRVELSPSDVSRADSSGGGSGGGDGGDGSVWGADA